LVVLTDDMRLDDLQFMPNVRSLIGDQGVTFDNYFDNVTLCCPARVSILRGQYSHNTGVLTNGPPNGGFETAHGTNIEQSTIATTMQSAGYMTGLFGKYLNGYPHSVSASYVPPGWDQWSSASKGNAYGEFDYTLNENGKQVEYGQGPDDYGTNVYVRQAKDFIDHAASASKPFLAYLAVYAPHQPATPAPQDTKMFQGLQAPRDASYDEADVSDKPQFIQRRPNLSQNKQRDIDTLYRKRAQSLQAVDRGVQTLVDALRADNQLDDTVVIFTSDNGFHLGQHRLPAGKQTAYETDVHLPLLVRGPGFPPGTHVAQLAGNIDLAPTIAALGGTDLEDDPDGRSLLPLVAPGGERSAWRQAYLLEHWNLSSSAGDSGGQGQREPDDLDQSSGEESPAASSDTATTVPQSGGGIDIPPFQGLRLQRYTYVEYATGERELYDLEKDPDQLDNLAGTADPALLDVLHARLEAMRTCSGGGCRDVENAPLNLPG
jgi:arylsulfatase A-like enzyme